MRSPVSPHLELDGAGSMVNCTIKTEEKKEGGYESPPGAAPSTESRPNDPPGPPPREGTDPQALPQVGPMAVTNTGPGWGPAGLAELCGHPCSGPGLIPQQRGGVVVSTGGCSSSQGNKAET